MDIKVNDISNPQLPDPAYKVITKDGKPITYASINMLGPNSASNPWSADEIDKLELGKTDFHNIIKACRFFYKKDPIVSSTLNKLVEIGINKIQMKKNGLSENEFRIFDSIRLKLEEFAEVMALEYLISGLVVPEIRYSRATKEELTNLGIKKYPTLVLPATMFIRDPSTILIKQNFLSDNPSYFVKIPDDVIMFIKNKGSFGDSTKDESAFRKLQELYPDLVNAVQNGATEMLLETDLDLIIRRKIQPDNPYPVPYLSSALESLKHKRNLRRMDYSIAARVIGAIQLFKLGSDEFPVTEDDKSVFDDIKSQMLWRDGTGKDVERIFQLFANHTLQIEWVMPDTAALLNEQKYVSVNQDIIYALGFPRILITGEAERTGTSDPQYAMMSPSRTMENFRKQIAKVIQRIVDKVAEDNNLKASPTISFKPLTLFDHQTLLKSLADLYIGGNISRTTYAGVLGYDWEDETNLREQEQKTLTEKGLMEIAPQPFSNNQNPNGGGNQNPNKSNPSNVKNQSNNRNGEN